MALHTQGTMYLLQFFHPQLHVLNNSILQFDKLDSMTFMVSNWLFVVMHCCVHALFLNLFFA